MAKNEFSDYLFANNIACGVTESDGTKVMGMLLDMLKRHFPQLNVEEARAEIEKRETKYLTEMEEDSSDMVSVTFL